MLSLDDTILNNVINPIDANQFGSDLLRETAQEMLDSLSEHQAIGLAANQCNINLRMFVMRTQGRDFVCCNPEILDISEDTAIEREGCLSFPLLYISVRRAKKVKAKWFDAMGIEHVEELTGMASVCFQHEYDHLFGITFKDRAGKFALELALKKQAKLRKEVK
jgi:peptide deformylase